MSVAEKMLDKLKKMSESGELERTWNEFITKIENKEKLLLDRGEKLVHTKSLSEFEMFMELFITWESKYENMYYKRGIIDSSNVLSSLFAVASKFGTDIMDESKLFLTYYTLYIVQNCLLRYLCISKFPIVRKQ